MYLLCGGSYNLAIRPNTKYLSRQVATMEPHLEMELILVIIMEASVDPSIAISQDKKTVFVVCDTSNDNSEISLVRLKI